MLELSGVTKRFGGVEALKEVGFVVPTGQVTAIVGPNGAGKTTLFDIIGGLIRPDIGEIKFNGVTITHKQPHEIARLGISRTFQQVRLFKFLSIADNLIMAEGHDDEKLISNIIHHKKIDFIKYKEICSTFGITKDPLTLVSDLSYGQRKLLNMAMAFNQLHKLLMLDEPVAGVNTVTQEKIESLLLRMKENKETILLIDHDMEFVRRMADRVVFLDAGQVLCEGTPSEVLSNQAVAEAYLGV